jgi:hypothetical protein
MRLYSTGLAVLIVLMSTQVNANPLPPVVHGHQMPTAWWEAACRGAASHGTDPYRIVATAAVESNVARHGWYSGLVKGSRRYVSPMGFNVACSQSRGGRVPDEVIWSPEKQIEWAARLLKGNLSKRLGKYNEAPDKNNYRQDVCALARQLQQEGK